MKLRKLKSLRQERTGRGTVVSWRSQYDKTVFRRGETVITGHGTARFKLSLLTSWR